jgi:hypothetical protein
MFLLTKYVMAHRAKDERYIFIWVLAHKEKYMPSIVKGLQSPTHTS